MPLYEYEEEGSVQPSHYAHREECTIRDTTNRKPPVDHEPAAGTEIITMLLRKYGFLTRRLISRCLITHKHGTIDPVKSLRKMQQQEIIKKYTVEDPDGDGVSLFCLSERARAALSGLKGYRYDMTSIPYIMEVLSAAQWSISLKSEKAVTEVMYAEYVQTKERVVLVPSLSRFAIMPGKNMYILAVPVGRGKSPDDLRVFLDRLSGLNSYFTENMGKYRSVQTVLICESMKQAEDTCRLLSRITELAGEYYLYTTDAITADENACPLELLYGGTLLSDGNVEFSVYSIKPVGVFEAVEKKIHEVAGKAGDKAKRVKDWS